MTSTPVGQHGPEYRDHLVRLFQRHASLGERKAAFAVNLKQQRREYIAGLAAAKAPGLVALQAKQKAQLVALRQRFDAAKQTQKIGGRIVATPRAGDQQERRTLLVRQRTEASAMRAKHAEETQKQQKAWADLNQARRDAWDDYKARRAKQVEARKTKDRADPSTARDPAQERGTLDSYAASRAVNSRDTGRGRDGPRDGQRDGHGSGSGPSITRKGPR